MSLFTATPTGLAQRPSAARLLPEATVVYLRIGNVQELTRKFQQTAWGRISGDAQVQPLVRHLYGSVLSAFEKIEGQIGASLEELLKVAQGEVSIALVLPEEGQPNLVLLVDVGEKLAVAEKLLERGDDVLIGAGATRTSEDMADTEITIYRTSRGRQQELATFVREGVVVVANSAELARGILSVWDGDESKRVLAQNRKFVSIMNRSRGLKDEPPQLTWFADPLGLAKRVAQGNLAGQAGLVTLKAFGLEGLKAIGGGVVLLTDEFDAVTQTHLLVGHPREGIVRMIALESGELIPEPWVPTDAASYASFRWNFKQTYDELVRLVDLIRGEGAWEELVHDRISKQLGVNLERDLLPAVEGRVTYTRWIERPARLNSQAALVGVRLVDAGQFREMLETIASRLDAQLEPASYRGNRYFRWTVPRRGNDTDSTTRRVPAPCIAVVGDYLLISDSAKLLQEAIITKSDASRSLANELDFKLVVSKIKRQQGPVKAGSVSFNRPEEGIRLLYELANSPQTQDRMADSEQPLLTALSQALDEHPLPPFSVIAKYLAPGGSMITYDELGLHRIGFSLRRR